jgi:hypothetical protein
MKPEKKKITYLILKKMRTIKNYMIIIIIIIINLS